MWILLLFLLLIILLLGSFFVLPMQFILQSEKNIFRVQIPYVFKLEAVEGKFMLKLDGKVLFFPFSLNVESLINAYDKTESSTAIHVKGKPRKWRRPPFHQVFKAIKELYYALKIQHLYATFDTGDYPTNAQLIPVLIPFQRKNVTIEVNFVNYNMVDAKLFTQLYKVFWIFFKNFRTKKK